MNKSKIQISAKIIDAIAESQELCESEKLNFLKYVWYLSYSEQKELCTII